jgi:sugar phosphate isomerase/epimerase
MYKNLNAAALGVSGHQSEIIELALTYGFRGMDVDIVEIARRAEKQGMPYAKRLIESAKIKIGTFPLPLDWDVDDGVFKLELEKLAEYAGVAKEIGCTRCVATVAPAGDKRPYHENFEFHRHRFAEICKVLEPYGLWLGVGFRAGHEYRKGHAFQFIHDLDAVKLLTNMAGTANIGLLLDSCELHIAGASAEDIRGLRTEQIVAVQLADLKEDVPLEEVTDQHRMMPGATGRIDIPAMLAALAEVGYDGPVTARPAKRTLASTRRDDLVKELADTMNRIWQAAGLVSNGKRVSVAAER